MIKATTSLHKGGYYLMLLWSID